MDFNKEFVIAIILLWSVIFSTGAQFDVSAVRLPPSIIVSPQPETFLWTSVDASRTRTRYSLIYSSIRGRPYVELVCEATGSKPLGYTWTRDGNTIDIDAEGLILYNGNLIIHSPSNSHTGVYQCIVSNDYGKVVSNTSVIKMAVDGGNFSEVVNVLTVELGKPFRIPANSPKILPAVEYRWERVGEYGYGSDRVFLDERVQMNENGDLYFAYAKQGDGYDYNNKLYMRVTTNEEVELRSSYTKVVFLRTGRSNGAGDFTPLSNASASFPEDNITYTALVGRNLTLYCFFSAKPAVLYYSWKFPKFSNRRVEILENSYEMRGAFRPVLIIPNITYSDGGFYRCTGSNGRGPNGVKNYKVLVEEVPVFRREEDGPTNKHVTEGDSVTFNCRAEGKPTPTNVWYINGKVLNSTNIPRRMNLSLDEKSLTIQNVCKDCTNSDRANDQMVVQCNSSNIHGYILGTGYLNVLAKTVVTVTTSHPIQDGIVKVKDKDYGTYRFQCSVVTQDKSPVPALWWKVVEKEYNEDYVLVKPDNRLIFVEEGEMRFRVSKLNTSRWSELVGTFRCGADRLFSSQFKSVTLALDVLAYQSDAQKLISP